MYKKIGDQSVKFENPPRIKGFYSIVGEKEGQGPLKNFFDMIVDDAKFGENSWEKAESKFIETAMSNAVTNAEISMKDIEYVFAGDLINQCIASNYAVRQLGRPFYGLYGACSTMAESLSLAAMCIDGGFAKNVIAATSSHFCASEKQFRFPLEYGGERPPTSQWTVTGAGAVVLSSDGQGPFVDYITTGKVLDLGITDMNNMGAAMAPAAADTIISFFKDTEKSFDDYDLVITGDLGSLGSEILKDLLTQNGFVVSSKLQDCGVKIFNAELQDVHSGGSGCGCSASVLTSYILKSMKKGIYKKVLFVATGALMNPIITQQGESIPCIAHLVSLGTEV